MAQFKLDQRVEILVNVGVPLMQINIHSNLQIVIYKLLRNLLCKPRKNQWRNTSKPKEEKVEMLVCLRIKQLIILWSPMSLKRSPT
jgi:hypothetical protein